MTEWMEVKQSKETMQKAARGHLLYHRSIVPEARLVSSDIGRTNPCDL